MKNFVENNRRIFADKLKDNSIAVIFCGKVKTKLGDEKYPFTPNRNFYYLTAIDKPNLALMIVKKDNAVSTTIFTERFDEVKAQGGGPVITGKECESISAVTSYRYLDEFDEVIGEKIFNGHTENIYLDLENRSFSFEKTEAIMLANRIMKQYPGLNIIDCHNILAKMRHLKTDIEVEKIKKAIDITAKGIDAMLKNTRAGMFEYEIEAYFDFELKKAGVKDFAFKSIAASGANATVLHYSENNCKTADNDLILLDVGAQYDYYNGDITRTFPVNGKFTTRQKQLYDIVLGGNRLIVNTIKPGIPFKSLNETLKAYYAAELKKIGLIKNDDEVSKYYYHGVSHMLGLETHDVGRHNEGLLEAGMVLTVEPGLYIEQESIGIRIEDDVLVTDNGCIVLSPDIPRTTEEIEAVMAEGIQYG